MMIVGVPPSVLIVRQSSSADLSDYLRHRVSMMLVNEDILRFSLSLGYGFYITERSLG